MLGLVYVILPFSDVPPGEAIARSLTRFQRGGRETLPHDWLKWHDDTAEVEHLYRTLLTFQRDGGLRTEGSDSWLIDTHSILAAMEERGVDRWTVRFADISADLPSFARDYLHPLERHPVTHGFGGWHNGLGRQDWWDLGGRFNGAITGESRRSGDVPSHLSSGPSRGRAALEAMSQALADAIETEPEPEPPIDISADENIELVSHLRAELQARREKRLPTDVLLPPGVVSDELRWLQHWPEPPSVDALQTFGLQSGVDWRQVIEAAYDLFADHWAAGIAFHF